MMMFSRKGGSSDDDSCGADGGFKDRVLHFSSPVFMVSSAPSALSDHKTI